MSFLTVEDRVRDANYLDLAALHDYAVLYGIVERKLFADFARGKELASLRSAYLLRYGITSRQFNAIRTGLEGKIDSIRELNKAHVLDVEAKIKSVTRRMRDTIKSRDKHLKVLTQSTRLSDKARQKVQAIVEGKDEAIWRARCKLDRLNNQLTELKSDKVGLCFGSAKLFNAQHHLAENGYADHREWKHDWTAARSGQFFVQGSKDETAGCQGGVLVDHGDHFTLQVRLPHSLAAVYSKKHVLLRLNFSYGAELLRHALKQQQAISYRFVSDEKGWRVCATTGRPAVATVTHKHLGAIGVDINADHLACAETDRFGNIIKTWRIDTRTAYRSGAQRDAILGDAVRDLMAYALSVSKPVVVENLDFKRKKRSLDKLSARASRALSSFHYSAVTRLIESRAHKLGIELIKVNPAYSSVQGRALYSRQKGVSVHMGAASVLARRGLGLTERACPSQHVWLRGAWYFWEAPVRMPHQTLPKFWQAFSRNLVALAAQVKSAEKQALSGTDEAKPCSAPRRGLLRLKGGIPLR